MDSLNQSPDLNSRRQMKVRSAEQVRENRRIFPTRPSIRKLNSYVILRRRRIKALGKDTSADKRSASHSTVHCPLKWPSSFKPIKSNPALQSGIRQRHSSTSSANQYFMNKDNVVQALRKLQLLRDKLATVLNVASLGMEPAASVNADLPVANKVSSLCTSCKESDSPEKSSSYGTSTSFTISESHTSILSLNKDRLKEKLFETTETIQLDNDVDKLEEDKVVKALKKLELMRERLAYVLYGLHLATNSIQPNRTYNHSDICRKRKSTPRSKDQSGSKISLTLSNLSASDDKKLGVTVPNEGTSSSRSKDSSNDFSEGLSHYSSTTFRDPLPNKIGHKNRPKKRVGIKATRGIRSFRRKCPFSPRSWPSLKSDSPKASDLITRGVGDSLPTCASEPPISESAATAISASGKSDGEVLMSAGKSSDVGKSDLLPTKMSRHEQKVKSPVKLFAKDETNLQMKALANLIRKSSQIDSLLQNTIEAYPKTRTSSPRSDARKNFQDTDASKQKSYVHNQAIVNASENVSALSNASLETATHITEPSTPRSETLGDCECNALQQEKIRVRIVTRTKCKDSTVHSEHGHHSARLDSLNGFSTNFKPVHPDSSKLSPRKRNVKKGQEGNSQPSDTNPPASGNEDETVTAISAPGSNCASNLTFTASNTSHGGKTFRPMELSTNLNPFGDSSWSGTTNSLKLETSVVNYQMTSVKAHSKMRCLGGYDSIPSVKRHDTKTATRQSSCLNLVSPTTGHKTKLSPSSSSGKCHSKNVASRQPSSLNLSPSSSSIRCRESKTTVRQASSLNLSPSSSSVRCREPKTATREPSLQNVLSVASSASMTSAAQSLDRDDRKRDSFNPYSSFEKHQSIDKIYNTLDRGHGLNSRASLLDIAQRCSTSTQCKADSKPFDNRSADNRSKYSASQHSFQSGRHSVDCKTLDTRPSSTLSQQSYQTSSKSTDSKVSNDRNVSKHDGSFHHSNLDSWNRMPSANRPDTSLDQHFYQSTFSSTDPKPSVSSFNSTLAQYSSSMEHKVDHPSRTFSVDTGRSYLYPNRYPELTRFTKTTPDNYCNMSKKKLSSSLTSTDWESRYRKWLAARHSSPGGYPAATSSFGAYHRNERTASTRSKRSNENLARNGNNVASGADYRRDFAGFSGSQIHDSTMGRFQASRESLLVLERLKTKLAEIRNSDQPSVCCSDTTRDTHRTATNNSMHSHSAFTPSNSWPITRRSVNPSPRARVICAKGKGLSLSPRLRRSIPNLIDVTNVTLKELAKVKNGLQDLMDTVTTLSTTVSSTQCRKF